MDEHTHTHPNGGLSAEETLALLKYMAQHNTHHAEELNEAANGVKGQAQTLLHEAVSLLEASTQKIEKAIGLMGE